MLVISYRSTRCVLDLQNYFLFKLPHPTLFNSPVEDEFAKILNAALLHAKDGVIKDRCDLFTNSQEAQIKTNKQNHNILKKLKYSPNPLARYDHAKKS